MATAHALATVDGCLHAAGPAYKATFAGGVFEYVPALGDRVDRNQTWSFRLETIRRGDTVVHAADAASPPVPHQSGCSVQLQRGQVVERYDVRADGIEQSFVFATPVPGEGDLVVTGRVASTLAPRLAQDGAIRFEAQGIGGVMIGEVFGVDAAGRRVRGSGRLCGDRLELVLPAAFVATATLPLVLDPLIGTTFAVSTNDAAHPDCAYDHGTNRWIVVWQQRFSLTDVDVYGVLIAADTGAQVGPLILLNNDVFPCTRPRVAGIAGADSFLIAYQRGDSPVGRYSALVQVVDAATGNASTSYVVATGLAREPLPVVSGEATELGDSGLVAWRGAGILAARFTVPAAGPPVPAGTLTVTTSPFAFEPEISRTGGNVGRHLVAWTESALGSDGDLYGRVVSRDLVPLTPGTVLIANSANDGQPAVDGNGTEFLVAHARTEPSGSLRDVRCLRVEYAAGALFPGSSNAIEATPNEDELTPDIAWLGPKYCVAFVERPAVLQDDVGAWLVDSSCTVCNARMTLPGLNASPGANREWGPRIGGRWVYAQNGYNDDGLVVFAESLDVPPFTGTVAAQRVEALGPGLPPVHLGGACGNGGTPAISAPFVVGSSGLRFVATGLEPAAAVLLSLGLPGAPLTCGGCTLLSPVDVRFAPNLSGTASSQFPIPCDPGYVGFVLEFQWVSLLTSTSPCPAVAGLSASERLQLTLGM